MEFGIGLPHLGALADPDAIRTVAIAAEAAGMSSVWAMDRLLRPVSPRTLGYPGTSDGRLPPAQHVVFDPLVTLTVAASVTERMRLGTDVLVAPWYAPVPLARSLAALDQLSRGRLTAGLGLGWSIDQFEAVGAPIAGRGQRLEEILDVMRAVWTQSVVEITTTRERTAPSAMGLKPAQLAGPPILLAATSPAGLDRIARRADGWVPFGLPPEQIAAGWHHIRTRAAEAGCDSHELRLVVRTDPRCTDGTLGPTRPAFTGSCRQILADLDDLRTIGANEVILDLHETAQTVDHLLHLAHDLSRPTLAAAA